MILKIIPSTCIAGVNSCTKLLPETLAKQFNLTVSRALPVSHVVIFTLQGHYSQLFRQCKEVGSYPLGVAIRGLRAQT
jgi:hypothetical protein